MEELQAAGMPVHTVGKIGQVFDSVGVDVPSTRVRRTRSRCRRRHELMDSLETGFVFTNLVETNQVYGHRNDVPGYHGSAEGDRCAGGGVARPVWTRRATC